MNKCTDLCGDGGMPSSPNDIKILLKNLQKEVLELVKKTEAKMLCQDGKIAELCVYVKNNLSNSIRCLLDSMEQSGELDQIIINAITKDIEVIKNGKLLGLEDGANVTELLNSLLKGGNITLYIPEGKYYISKPIELNDNTTVVCHSNAEFILTDNAKCIMFRTSNKAHKNIAWYGGILNGNDENQGLKETSATNKDFDFSNAFRFLKVTNLTVKNVRCENIRGHAIEHWNCNYVEFDNIEIRALTDRANFPTGGSRRDGIHGSSSNLIINNVYGFADDDLIGLIAGATWHEAEPSNCENVTITNVSGEYNGDYPTHSLIRCADVNGYTFKNLNINNVYGDTVKPAIRLGGYGEYKNGTMKNISINNVNVKVQECWDEEGIILISQCNFGKIKMNNINGSDMGTFKPTLLTIIDASIDELIVENTKLEVNGTYTSRVPFIKINQNSETLGEYIEGIIKRIVLSNVTYNYTDAPSPLILIQGTKVQETPIRLEILNCNYDDNAKYSIANNNNSIFSICSPGTYISNSHLNDAYQRNGDVVLCSNGYIYTWVNDKRCLVNNKPIWLLQETAVSKINVNDLDNRALVKLNVVMDITGIDGATYGQEITLLCGKSGTKLTHSDTFRLKGEANVNMIFMNAITFVRDNTGRWIEIARNF